MDPQGPGNSAQTTKTMKNHENNRFQSGFGLWTAWGETLDLTKSEILEHGTPLGETLDLTKS